MQIYVNRSEITSSSVVVIGDETTSDCNDRDVSSTRGKRAATIEPNDNRMASNGKVQDGTTYTAFTRSYVLVGDMVWTDLLID